MRTLHQHQTNNRPRFLSTSTLFMVNLQRTIGNAGKLFVQKRKKFMLAFLIRRQSPFSRSHHHAQMRVFRRLEHMKCDRFTISASSLCHAERMHLLRSLAGNTRNETGCYALKVQARSYKSKKRHIAKVTRHGSSDFTKKIVWSRPFLTLIKIMVHTT